jgi:hypothetical protein
MTNVISIRVNLRFVEEFVGLFAGVGLIPRGKPQDVLIAPLLLI